MIGTEENENYTATLYDGALVEGGDNLAFSFNDIDAANGRSTTTVF